MGIGSRFKKHQKILLEVERELYQVKFGLDIESDAEEVAYQIGIITREGAYRVIDYAFELAEKRRRKLTSVDKANVLSDMYGLWREVFTGCAKSHPGVTSEFNFVDAVTMWFVKNPEWFDVVVTPNMFGDIITDLGAMIQGGLGLAPGGNINPEGTRCSNRSMAPRRNIKGKTLRTRLLPYGPVPCCSNTSVSLMRLLLSLRPSGHVSWRIKCRKIWVAPYRHRQQEKPLQSM